jgi:hypothetical protein
MAYSEQKALAGLKEHRAELAAQLARVDGAIAALSGGSAKRGRPAKDAKLPAESDVAWELRRERLSARE